MISELPRFPAWFERHGSGPSVVVSLYNADVVCFLTDPAWAPHLVPPTVRNKIRRVYKRESLFHMN